MTAWKCNWSGVTIDCVDPVSLGRFWAPLLDLQPSDALPGWIRLGQRGQGLPVINLQPVPEPKQGKTRIHLDMTVPDIDDGIARVIKLGGCGPAERHDYDEGIVVVMADPEGNEFCLTQYFSTADLTDTDQCWSPSVRRMTERHSIRSGSIFEEQIGYARAVVDGDWVHVSGTTGFDYATMTISNDVVEQTEQCLRNIDAALSQAGCTFADVVRVRYLLPDRADFEPCWPTLRRAFGEVKPAATMLMCGLADSRMKIEIEVYARRATA